MFTYFHKHKRFRNNRGQLLPIFIVIIVVIIIMVLVTVNIGKVAFTKTDTANSADSASLAGSSAMASLFNNIAVANSYMEVSFQEFYLDSAVMTTVALASLITAQITSTIGTIMCATGLIMIASGAAMIATGIPPVVAAGIALVAAGTAMWTAGATLVGIASGAMALVISSIIAMTVSTTAFSIAQQFFYMSIRKMADQGWKSSIRIGHQLSFKNSGTSSKLKSAPLGDILTDPNFNYLEFSNYQEAFAWFMKLIVQHQTPMPLPYPWIDGQGRYHIVASTMLIDKVDTFALKTTVMPLPAELGVLAGALAVAIIVVGLLPLCLIGVPAAPLTMTGIYPLLAAYMAGLTPSGGFVSTSSGDSSMFIIDCIQDVIHSHLVTAVATQNHRGEDLGLWTTRYPDREGLIPTVSFSVAQFSGGRIYPPDPRYDSGLIFTDLSIPVEENVPETNGPLGKAIDSVNLMASGLALNNEAEAASPADDLSPDNLNCKRAIDAVKRLEIKLGIYNESTAALREAANQTAASADEMDGVVGSLKNKLLGNALAQNKDTDKDIEKDMVEKYDTLKDKITGESTKIIKAANQMIDASCAQANEAASIQDEIDKIKAINPGCDFN